MQRREYPIKTMRRSAIARLPGSSTPTAGSTGLAPPRSRSFSGALHRSRKRGEFFSRPRATIASSAATSATLPSLRRAFVTEHGVVRRTDIFVIARERSERFYDFTSLRPFNPWAHPH